MVSDASRLSFDQASAICEQFAPIGDHIFDYMDALAGSGYGALAPIAGFVDSFAADAGERELHQECVIELAKDVLTRPWPMPIFDETKVVKSAFIRRLKEQYASDHNEPAELVDSIKIDPCLRRRKQVARDDPRGWQSRWDLALAGRQDCIASEVLRHGSGLARQIATGMLARAKFYGLVMEREAAKLGFTAKRRNPLYIPVFSRRLSENWNACFTIEEQNLFYSSPYSGSFNLFLELRSVSYSNKQGRPGELLHIKYQRVVPGFFQGYSHFNSLDELEVLIKAHLRLYELMSPILERCFAKVPQA